MLISAIQSGPLEVASQYNIISLPEQVVTYSYLVFLYYFLELLQCWQTRTHD